MINDKYDTFDKFIKNYLSKDSIYINPMLVPQSNYIFDHFDVCKVDKIIKYENLSDEIIPIFNKLNIKSPLQHLNSGNNGDYKKHYSSSKTLEHVNYIYERDINLLKYCM